MARKRFALVGASSRGRFMYAHPICRDFKDVAELVGIFDINIGRARVVGEECHGVPAFDSFETMMQETKPDAIIVATVDKFHVDYVLKGLEAGVQVYCEKPMCIDAEQCRRILEAEKKYNNHITVTFNLRFSSWLIKLKQLVPELVGTIYTINLDWMLPRNKVSGNHGASYYRRWNAFMDMSGGMLVTKATHHFDMINWLLESRPVNVSAFGQLRVYGKNGERPAERCSNCPKAGECEFFYPIGPDIKKLYVDNEKYDGYIIDRCVFEKNINIYDNMALAVEYENKAILNYTESSAAAYEGFKMVINGEKGRIEVNFFEKGGLRQNERYDFIRYISMNGDIATYSLPRAGEGDHGGADPELQNYIFRGKKPVLPSQCASSIDGAFSILTGAAANVSIREGRKVNIDELIGDPSLFERN